MQDMHTQTQYLHAPDSPVVPLPAPDLGSVPLRVIQAAPAPSPGLSALRRTVTRRQRLFRLIRPFHRAALKENIRAWLPDAVKDPRSAKAGIVANWSFELRTTFGE